MFTLTDYECPAIQVHNAGLYIILELTKIN